MAAKKKQKKPAKKSAKKKPGSRKPNPAARTMKIRTIDDDDDVDGGLGGASKEQRVEALAKVFQALGAKNPKRWAELHVEESTDELGRFVLLRALWLRLVEPGRLLANAASDAAAGPVVGRLMKTTSLADLDALVRFAQRTAVVDVCRVLDDTGENDGIRWSLFRVDGGGQPLWPLSGLKADLDETEP